MSDKTVTWKQVTDRGILGAHRGKGIFVDLLSKKLDPDGRMGKIRNRPEHKDSKKYNQDSL